MWERAPAVRPLVKFEGPRTSPGPLALQQYARQGRTVLTTYLKVKATMSLTQAFDDMPGMTRFNLPSAMASMASGVA